MTTSRPLAKSPHNVFAKSTGVSHHKTILVVDDERSIADSLVFMLGHSGYTAVAAYSGEDAVQHAKRLQPHLLLADVMMPGKNGIDTAVEVCHIVPSCRAVLFSGHPDDRSFREGALKKGYAFDWIEKPLHPEELLSRIRIILAG
jgi:DNA-binding response OmpR family regulator